MSECKECNHYKVCKIKQESNNSIYGCNEFLQNDKKGEWKELDVCKHVCSVCGAEPYVDGVGEILSTYCPHCGSRLFRKTPYGVF